MLCDDGILYDYIGENDVDIMIIVESWLKESDDVVIGECTPPGYTFLNMPRDSENRGGGIAMLYKTPLKGGLVLSKCKFCSIIKTEKIAQ